MIKTLSWSLSGLVENYEAIMIAVDMENESKDWRDVVLHGRFQTVQYLLLLHYGLQRFDHLLQT